MDKISAMACALVDLSRRPEVRKAWIAARRCHVTVSRATRRRDGEEYRVITVRDGRRTVISPRDDPACLARVDDNAAEAVRMIERAVRSDAALARRLERAELHVQLM